MIPQERDLLSNLVSRLKQTPAQGKDPEAEAMIGDLVRAVPDAPYILAQTVLVQDYALHQAQDRIAQLERQLQSGGQGQHEGGGFLSAIFGSGKPPQQRPQPPAQPPAYAQAPSPQASGPWGAAPAQAYTPAQQVFAQPSSGQPSFLRSAATTAAGVAGGALLFQGIESLLGGGHGGFGGYGAGFGGAGFVPQPGLTETTINNYYDTPTPDSQTVDYGNAADTTDVSYDNSDSSFDDSGSFDDGGGDFGGTDV
jgi:hypothetical protein